MACRRPFEKPNVPSEFSAAVRAWNLLGGLDWNGLDWAMNYLGITNKDQLVLDLITLRDKLSG